MELYQEPNYKLQIAKLNLDKGIFHLLRQFSFLILLLIVTNNIGKAQNFPCLDQGTPVLNLSDILGTQNNTSGFLLSTRFNNAISNNYLFEVAGTSNPWWPIPSSFPAANTITNGAYTGSLPILQPVGTLRRIVITSDFIVDQSINFEYSEILMLADAKIIIQSGCSLSLKECILHACGDVLWDRIEVTGPAGTAGPGHLISIGNSIIEDATNAVYVLNGGQINLHSLFFNKNLIGILMEGPTISTNSVIGGAVSFTCLTNPFYPTITNFPLTPFQPLNSNSSGKTRAEAGIKILSGSNQFTYLLGSATGGFPSLVFKELDYGIHVNNANFNVVCADFSTILNQSTSPFKYSTMGSAIYAAGIKSNETIVSKKMATIGGANTGGLYKRCKFDNCTRGIYLVKDYGAMITNNTLSQISYAGIDINNSINTQLIVNNNAITDFNQGLRFINCISNSVFAVQYNVLDQSGAALSPAAGSYQNTGMLFLNSTLAYSNAKVTNNVILECRNGIVGSGLVYANFTSNFIRYDRPQAQMQNLLHNGFWMDNCYRLNLISNVIQRNTAINLNTWPNALQEFRGMNLKSNRTSSIIENEMIQCGRPIRLLDDFMDTYFVCNTFNNCAGAWALGNAGSVPNPLLNLPVQGSILNAAGNRWINYGGTERMTGLLNIFTDYYYLSTSSDHNPNAGGGSSCFNLNPKQSNLNNCIITDSRDDENIAFLEQLAIDSIFMNVDSNNSYQKTLASAYSLIRDQSYSSPLLNILYYNTELTQEAIYAAFTDSMYSNDELLDMIQSLPYTLISEIQERRELFEIALMNQIAGYDSIEYNWSELEDLAYTNVREGSIAVYLARAILEKEVDDEEYGLRINYSVSTNQNCNFNIHKSEQFISTKFEGEYEIQIFDAAGKLIQKNSAVNNKQISIASIPSSSIYMLRCVASSCSTSYKFSK